MRASRTATTLAALVVLAPWLPRRAAAAPAVTVVACAPGYPGTRAEAQPHMDAFAAALARAARWPEGSIAAVYEPVEKAGLARLSRPDAAIALVPLPFVVKHGEALKLAPRLVVATQGGAPMETWTLVAKKGRVSRPVDLAGFTVSSIAGYSPAFVRGALATWGRLPDDAKVAESTQVLSALRRTASGADLAVLLDAAQAAALPSLPFAWDLEVVARSQPLPSAFVATVGARLSAARWNALEGALAALPSDPQGAAALEGIRMTRFVPADAAALSAVRRLSEGQDR